MALGEWKARYRRAADFAPRCSARVTETVGYTGAGAQGCGFELLLDEQDCLQCSASVSHPVRLGGAYQGLFPTYTVRVQIPVLGFSDDIRAVGIRGRPAGVDGIAGFHFLNRFTYGNFGGRSHFGLEL